MAQEFKFRFRGSNGGLAVNLKADSRPLEDGHPRHGMQVYKKIWLGLPASGLHWKDAAWLAFGMSTNARSLSELFPDGLLVCVISLDYPLSEYRAEVAALAMDGWLHERFEIEDSGVSVRHDAVRDQFDFTWGDVALPFSDPPR
ncbi:hypothetical protein [Streptomyces sp. DT171]|uniref:hypothetical protein n=1 Tax=Streptomyces sp. DT171 TaxID=3416524 RepID=UPI003CE721DB